MLSVYTIIFITLLKSSITNFLCKNNIRQILKHAVYSSIIFTDRYDSIYTTNRHTCTYLQVMAGIEGVKPGAPKDPVKFPKRLPMKEKIPGPSQDAQFPKCMDHSAHPLPAPLFYSLEAFPQCSCAVGAPSHVAGFFPYVTEFSPLLLL